MISEAMDFRTRFLTETRLAFSAFRPKSHVLLTGIVGDGPIIVGWKLLSRYTQGERELQRERKLKAREPRLVWRSS